MLVGQLSLTFVARYGAPLTMVKRLYACTSVCADVPLWKRPLSFALYLKLLM